MSAAPSETTGASLTDAVERYKRYERKLADNVKPNEETLRKLNASSQLKEIHLQNMRINSNGFPIGGKLSFLLCGVFPYISHIYVWALSKPIRG